MVMDTADVRTVDELVAAVGQGAKPKFVFFWGHTARPDGSLSAACFSQWWPARFAADGHTFRSAEHYMMWRKACLFGDEQRAAAILQAHSPAQAKSLGRQVAGFTEDLWVANRWQIVVDASIAKFGSDEHLRGYLAGSKRRVLVEASPVDRVWGIGLATDSDQAGEPAQWRGLNLLGFALMEARHRLLS
jgi:ribA/ribD-fused uncharacterized protein